MCRDWARAFGAICTVMFLGCAANAAIFSNSTPISVPAGAPGSSSGPAAPYPSSILVAGLDAPIADINVTISGLSHSFPDDLDILLVGPTGVTVMLMSDCGGSPDLLNVTLTFDDEAISGLPNGSSPALVSGSYDPTNFELTDAMPAPAPAGPYGAAMSVFDGLDGNGEWKLFVFDDQGNDFGAIAGGWSIEIRLVPGPSGLAALALLGLAGPRRSRRRR